MVNVLNRKGRIEVARPNWRSGVQQEFTFKTGIHTSYDGTEQRQALRQKARVSIQYRSLMDAKAFRRHIADAADEPAATTTIPASWRRVKLAATLPSANQLQVTEVPFWLVSGARIVVSDFTNEEAAVVQSISGTTVTLTANMLTGFGAGASVDQAYSVRIADRVQFRAETSRLWEANMRFEVDPGSDPQTYPAATPATFEGRELFLDQPNWRERPEIEFMIERQEVDHSIGRIDVSVARLDNTRIERLGYTAITPGKAEALIAFFLRHKGRRTGFFMPSWQEDIAVEQITNAGSNLLTIPGEDFADAFIGSKTFNVLIAWFADGTYQVNRILDLTKTGGKSVALMRNNWSRNVTPETRISFCHHWRFASDTLTVQWVTDKVAEIEVAVQTIQTEENQ